MTASMGSSRRKVGSRPQAPRSATPAAPRSRARQGSPMATNPRQIRRRPAPNNVKPLPIIDDRPSWLRSIMGVQTAVAGVTFLLVAGTLGVYGWSVNSQQRWGESYRRLETLRRNERQLVAGTEAIKHNIAQTTDPKQLGLEPQKSENSVFVQPAAPRPAPKPTTEATTPVSPLGY